MTAGDWQLELGNLYWLVLLAVVPPMIYFAGRSLATLSAKAGRALVCCQIASVALVLAALTEPRLLVAIQDRTIIALVDRSESIDPAGRKATDSLLQELAAAADSAGGVQVEVLDIPIAGPGRPSAAGNSPPEARPLGSTRLSAAMLAARARFSEERVGRMVLISDGTRPGPFPVASARNIGVPIDTVALPSLAAPELYVERFTGPRRARVGQTMHFTAWIRSNRQQRATVELLANGDAVARQGVELVAGTTKVRLSHPAGRVGPLRATVRTVGGNDTRQENNRYSLVVLIEPPPQALLVTEAPSPARHLADALKPAGFVVTIRSPSELPTKAEALGRYDLMVWCNLPVASFTQRQIEATNDYVRREGGGLLVVGGQRSLTAGGYTGTPVEAMLPVLAEPTRRQQRASLALVLVIDRSESMQGNKLALAKQATAQALELLTADDQVGVIAFEDVSGWIVPLEQAVDKRTVARRIAPMQAAGGTNMFPALEKAYLALRDTLAERKHVILLTDGISHPGDFHELAQRIKAEGISVSTIALGAEAGTAVLEAVARLGGGRFYLCANPADVPEVFALDTASATRLGIYEQPFFGQQVGRLPTAGPEVFDDLPALLGYVETVARPTARLVLKTMPGDPLLAWWRYGRGKTAVFTSDAEDRWATAWLDWPGFERFWGAVSRDLARAEVDTACRMYVCPARGHTIVGTQCVGPDGSFLTGAEAVLEVAAPDEPRRRVMLPETSPGRYATDVATDEPGDWSFRAIGALRQKKVFDERAAAVVAWSDELRLTPTNRELLRQIARVSGGQYNPSPAEIVEPDGRTVVQRIELWRWLLAAAVVVMVGGVGVRRLASPSQAPRSGQAGESRQPVAMLTVGVLGLLAATASPSPSPSGPEGAWKAEVGASTEVERSACETELALWNDLLVQRYFDMLPLTEREADRGHEKSP